MIDDEYDDDDDVWSQKWRMIIMILMMKTNVCAFEIIIRF